MKRNLFKIASLSLAMTVKLSSVCLSGIRACGLWLLVLLFTLHITLFTGFSEARTGSTGWWIFRRPQSAKTRSLTSVAAIRGDLSGVFYNPSILSTISQREIFLMSELGFDTGSFGGILYGHPFKTEGGAPKAGIVGGVIYYDAGKETLYFVDAGQEREKTVTIQRDILALLSYGHRLGENFSLGGTLKYANSNIAEARNANALAFDIGVSCKLDKITLSMIAQNIGFATKFIDRAEELPMSVSVGGSYYAVQPDGVFYGVGFDVPYIVNEGSAIPGIGVELGKGAFALNCGYRFNVQEGALTIGFGVNFANIGVNYAFIPAQYLSSSHRLSVGFRW